MINFDDVVDIEAIEAVAKAPAKDLQEEQQDRISGKVAVVAFSLILLLVAGASAVAELGSWRERLRGAMLGSRGPGFPLLLVTSNRTASQLQGGRP